MIAKHIAHTAVLTGHSVLFRTPADLLGDLEGEYAGLRCRKFRFCARPTLLRMDEIGYIAYDAHAADLLFEIVNHRYERNSILVTTNKARIVGQKIRISWRLKNIGLAQVKFM